MMITCKTETSIRNKTFTTEENCSIVSKLHIIINAKHSKESTDFKCNQCLK